MEDILAKPYWRTPEKRMISIEKYSPGTHISPYLWSWCSFFPRLNLLYIVSWRVSIILLIQLGSGPLRSFIVTHLRIIACVVDTFFPSTNYWRYSGDQKLCFFVCLFSWWFFSDSIMVNFHAIFVAFPQPPNKQIYGGIRDKGEQPNLYWKKTPSPNTIVNMLVPLGWRTLQRAPINHPH